MGEIADDHYVELFWSEGVGGGGDCGQAPPCDHPAYGGMNAYIQRHAQRSANLYRCKFCQTGIVFVDRKPYNPQDATPHRCLAEARRIANQTPGGTPT